jgi:hypothetical protein
MNRFVKSLVIFTISLFSVFESYSQLKVLSPTTHIITDVRKVVEDYPNSFANITGELIIQNPQSVDYHCTFKMKDAEECFVTKYHDDKKDIYSWQALMLTTEDFEQAVKQFKSLYGQLNNSSIGRAQLQGKYESPAEEKNFTSVLFSFDTDDELMKKLKLELVMENVLLQWKVKIIIYDREREDDEDGMPVE